MLKLKGVYKSFDDKHILNGVSLSVEKGKKITIIGPSGSGKSTILKLILGLLSPDKGKVVMDGVDITTLSIEDVYKMRKNVGLLFQSAALFDSMTVEENVGFALREVESRYSDLEIRYKIDQALDLVGMSGANNMFTSELSGGQQKRIGLARAIINTPQYLFFDEPTTGLDPVLSTNIEDLIVRISTELKTTAVVVTHQISTILRVSDEIYYLDNGKMLEPETPKSIMKSKQAVIHSFIHGKGYGTK